MARNGLIAHASTQTMQFLKALTLQARSMYFNCGMVSLDKAMVFNDSIWERPLVKAEIVYAPMLFIEAWSCETRNGLKMPSYGGGHWSRHCFATHKQCHCLEMYPYAFPIGFNLGLVSLDQAFVFNESICERPLFKAQIVYAPIMAIEEWFYVARNGLQMHQPRKGHCSKHWFASHEYAFQWRSGVIGQGNGFQGPTLWEVIGQGKDCAYTNGVYKAWSCETKNGLEMHSYGGGHWSRYWFASHKQGHCLEMYPYAFPMGFNLGLVPLDQAFVFNWSIWERSLFKAQIVYAPFIAIGEWLYVPRNRLHMHEPRQGHCWKHGLASHDHAFQ